MTASGRVVGIGVDLASIEAVRRMLERYSNGELGLVFTAGELCRGRADAHPARHLAVCFGAKEAVGKALRCGMAGMGWTDVEATVEGTRLSVALREDAMRRAASLRAHGVVASWSQFGAELVVVTVTIHG